MAEWSQTFSVSLSLSLTHLYLSLVSRLTHKAMPSTSHLNHHWLDAHTSKLKLCSVNGRKLSTHRRHPLSHFPSFHIQRCALKSNGFELSMHTSSYAVCTRCVCACGCVWCDVNSFIVALILLVWVHNCFIIIIDWNRSSGVLLVILMSYKCTNWSECFK